MVNFAKGPKTLLQFLIVISFAIRIDAIADVGHNVASGHMIQKRIFLIIKLFKWASI